ncbi:MAG: tRNA (adenosine(37)-N6)-dimethylallyltransferase MiaA [Christensenellales bacterium]
MTEQETRFIEAKGPLVVLTGPTASGKTELSLRIADRIGAEIVSADAIQVYRRLDIGSAKPTMEERQAVRHHMIDVADPDEDYSVARYQANARECIKGILRREKTPLVVGGTGLYVHALTYDVDFTRVRGNEAYRRELHRLAETKGRAHLHGMLRERDASRAAAIHENDTKRIIRALEILETGGERPYDFRKPLTGMDVMMLGLTMDRAKLYARIDRRVDAMIEAGLVAEVEGLLKDGYSPDLVSLQGLGYKEVADCLRGVTSLEEAAARIKRGTRRFAKRQMTWFKREGRMRWLDIAAYGSLEEAAQSIMDYIVKWRSGAGRGGG